MGKHGDGVSKRSPAATHNEISGVVNGPVVQTRSITGDVVITTEVATQSEADKWTEGLAQGVQTLWRREEAHRRIHDPVALPVRWHPAIPELADQWVNIRRLPAGTPAEPLALSGSIDQLGQIYQNIPSGRLVLLGPAGAGKTVLAARLALDLLQARQTHQPVPVIVSVGSWNPTTAPLHVWLAEKLARDHPGLAAPVHNGGPTRAAALIDTDRILPILDGFDEIDARLHPAALDQLNKITATPIVLTSRIEEYTTAVRGADVLTAAAVVELDELTPRDLAAYLPRTAAGPRTGIWDPLLERMRTEPHTPGPATLRQVLANSLMVFLARTVYSDTSGHDPTELLDTHRFPTAPAVRDHLLAAFVPSVYSADKPTTTRQRWSIALARRYLTYLAGHLHKAGTRDLAWWQLRDTIPRWHRTLVFALVDGLVAGLAGGLSLGLAFGFMVGLSTALASGLTVALTVALTRGLPDKPRRRFGELTNAFAIGLTVGFAGGLPVGLMAGIEFGLVYGFGFGIVAALMAGLVRLRGAGPQPTRTRLQIRGRTRFIAGRFEVGFWFGVGFVFVAKLISWFVSRSVGSHGFVDWVLFGFVDWLAFGFVFGLVAALVFGLEAPLQAADVVSAAQSLARDRRNAIRKMLTVGPVAGIVVGIAGVANGIADPLITGLMTTVMVIVGYGSVRTTSASTYWLVLVRVWLPLTGRLPWRVEAFLTDAYQRGVLRQTGAVYQFRHAWLQDHLIAQTPTAAPPAED